jgi:aminoglycoside/choline kinase family phosphotransferase
MSSSEVLIQQLVSNAYIKHFGMEPVSVFKLPLSGSSRLYFRLNGEQDSVIGTYSTDPDESLAFIYLSTHFAKKGLPVPEVLYYDKENGVYLQTDLGDITLYSVLENADKETAILWHKKALSMLIQFQTEGAKGLNFNYCFPRHSFDFVSIIWDLNYFKYSFLKPSGIPFHEGRLQNDFEKLSSLAANFTGEYFLYRDFQSRNIMVKDNELFFIDFQGGRKGALAYDPASFIFTARSVFDIDTRLHLLDFYRDQLKKAIGNTSSFDNSFPLYLLVRILQTFGAYGYRGWFERKTAFFDILPKAISNLRELLPFFGYIKDYDELKKVIIGICEFNTNANIVSPENSGVLNVEIRSFSYKKGIPVDDSGNGGGFVFDCRALPNPGKLDEYKKLSGNDKPVIKYLNEQPATDLFLQNVYSVVSQSVERYLSRGFSNLMVSFGCTGGQHRSVFCANSLAAFLKKRYSINVNLSHIEQPIWGGGENKK